MENVTDLKENEVLLDMIYFGMSKEIDIERNIKHLQDVKEKYERSYKNLRLVYRIDDLYKMVYADLIGERR